MDLWSVKYRLYGKNPQIRFFPAEAQARSFYKKLWKKAPEEQTIFKIHLPDMEKFEWQALLDYLRKGRKAWTSTRR